MTRTGRPIYTTATLNYFPCMPESKSAYLIEKYPDLVGSEPVEKAVKRRIASGEGGAKTKTERVDTYLARLEKITQNKGQTKSPETTEGLPERDAQYFKNLILDEYVLDTSDEATVATLAKNCTNPKNVLPLNKVEVGKWRI